ncbi:MAG: hypothetical protein AAGA92_02145 [Planctomycetota bacterium]
MHCTGRSAAALILLGVFQAGAAAQQTTFEDVGGVRYQVTRRTVQQQVPATVMRNQQQTYYAPQTTSQTVRMQQPYYVPVTEYRLVSKRHGRWNPFVRTYWTHQMEPVTRWQHTVANVEVPVTSTAMVAQTRTVQTPVTEMRSEQREIVQRTAIGPSPARTAARPPASTRAASIAAATTRPSGGIALKSDPPRQPSSWQKFDSQQRYR